VFVFVTDARQDDSVLSGIGPLCTPSDALVTPVATNSGPIGYGFGPGDLGNRGHNRQATETIDEDTPDIISGDI
jgi:hypothetical protein